MSGPNKIVSTSRSVIEHRLLVELENDKSKVAILCDKDDLNTLIAALLLSERDRMAMRMKWQDLRLSLEQLRKEAFGE